MTIDGTFAGPAYGVPTPGGLEAIRLLARTEAIFLDPVYTGKVMAALIAHVRSGELDPGDAVTFLHTGGGPSLFAHGTRTLLAPLWNVEQESALAFLETFFQVRSRDHGTTLAAAFQRTCLHVRERYPALFRWAPFALNGNWI